MLSSEEQEECKNYLRKTRDYLIKILDDCDSNLSVVKKVSCRFYFLIIANYVIRNFALILYFGNFKK